MPRGKLRRCSTHAGLLRLDVGVFVLHAVQLAMWVAIPALLVRPACPSSSTGTWTSRGAGFVVVMGMTRFRWSGEATCGPVLASAAVVTLVQVGLLLIAGEPGIGALAVLLFVFFRGFNVLSEPASMASRIAPPHARGAALGVYNMLQSLGFLQAGVGGRLAKNVGTQGCSPRAPG